MKNRPVVFLFQFMKKMVRPVLFLLMALITVRCGYTVTVAQTNGPSTQCTAQSSYSPELNRGIWITSCTITCPDGTTTGVIIHDPEIVTLIHTEQYCTGTSVTIQRYATKTPTAVPTHTPRPTLPTSLPLLSGDVTACSAKDGFINFKLLQNAPPFNPRDLMLTINGVAVQCTLAGTNNSLLSCPLPSGATFPAQIHMNSTNGSFMNDFAYDGGGCVVQSGPSGGGDGAVPTPKLGD